MQFFSLVKHQTITIPAPRFALLWHLSWFLALGVSPALHAQASTVPDEASLHEVVSVSYVVVPFVAYGSHGRPFRDLRPSEVGLQIDGSPVVPDFFEKISNRPISFTILLDGSGSMGLAGKIDGARDAIRALVRRPVKGDDYTLYVFAEGKVLEIVPFTTDAGRILSAVDDVEPFGETALYDALRKMPDRSLLGSNGGRAIILLTDGLDNASRDNLDTLVQAFQGVDVPVYPFGIRSSSTMTSGSRESTMNMTVLAGLAGMSGGRLSIANKRSELRGAVNTILTDLRAQYLIGFAPTGEGGVRYRSISLSFARPVQTVRVRAGYRGTEPPVPRGRN